MPAVMEESARRQVGKMNDLVTAPANVIPLPDCAFAGGWTLSTTGGASYRPSRARIGKKPLRKTGVGQCRDPLGEGAGRASDERAQSLDRCQPASRNSVSTLSAAEASAKSSSVTVLRQAQRATSVGVSRKALYVEQRYSCKVQGGRRNRSARRLRIGAHFFA